ncbi:dolichyl-diphosphooligosaccharide-protein glycotransferase SCDLUD_002913 [Saccharomycodes ludwigii]|uniref:dolichyl-diphosphooligosaccharide-protein glycotransferase n=1 Tax=Saccharomycodes ludwigii TaxID=36035 RepID=UPI001E861F98|nr:hypothetical protein SCDLUD_002913 [Saccharomycodes ludwigii]KAH3901421.1 hypothetical protein SCDLUD_002913 [Saccharomycodes ludwigii]
MKQDNTSSTNIFVQLKNNVLNDYFNQTIKNNNNLLILDLFNLSLVIIGLLQCIFMLLIRDTFPFNAFLSGFISCVSQFVLNVSLRLQIVSPFRNISEKRAFAEYIFTSLILHFICLHFIN